MIMKILSVCPHTFFACVNESILHIVRPRETITRPRDEDRESKKVRKAAVKAEQAERRAEKKVTKQAFGKELKSAKVKALQEHPTGVKKL